MKKLNKNLKNIKAEMGKSGEIDIELMQLEYEKYKVIISLKKYGLWII